MEMELTISLTVSIDESGANLNEVCAAVRETIMNDLPSQVGRELVCGIQEWVLKKLTTPCGQTSKKGFGRHENRNAKGDLCRFRTFVRQGYRPEDRRVNTDVGAVSFPVGYVSCQGCGKKFAPIFDVLDVGDRQRHTAGLERMVSEVVSTTSYRRGESEVEARGSSPVPRSSAHRWVATRKIPESSPEGAVTGMADGTRFKKWPGERGTLRVVIGLDSQGKPRPFGTYAGRDWESIGADVRRKLRVGKKGEIQLRLFAEDGEPGLDRHLASVADHAQRCVWHVPRDLGYALWEQGAPLAERKTEQQKLTGLVGMEIPEEDWEAIQPRDRQALNESVNRSESEIRSMAREFAEKGYTKAATYLLNAADKIFSHVRLWLETGIVAPRTTSILENIMRELGRRIKKLGWNWSDAGVEKIAKMILLKRFDKERWDGYWQEELGLQRRCRIEIRSIQRRAA